MTHGLQHAMRAGSCRHYLKHPPESTRLPISMMTTINLAFCCAPHLRTGCLTSMEQRINNFSFRTFRKVNLVKRLQQSIPTTEA